jgi:Brp/Blh family beta-carotene 15,15'-monooxygenase
MTDARSSIFAWIESMSRWAIGATIILFALLRLFGLDLNLTAQLTIALIALFVGIPHGAIDHLVSIPSKPIGRFILYIGIYVCIAVLSGWLIARWNVRGFQLVLIMSSLHFGYGDAAYRNEWREVSAQVKSSWLIETLYAIPAGFIPVILPLTDPHAGDALHRIHPSLATWAGTHSQDFRSVTLVTALLAILILVLRKSFPFAIDLCLLIALALIAPPLITFATYFGFWHAARHTARLVLKLPRSEELAKAGKGLLALWGAIFPGLYAVAGTAAVAVGLMLFDRHGFKSSLLWATLVVIWALTVPHMLSTSRFDLRALRK